MPNLFRIKATGEIFASNYIDYFNSVICKGDYTNKNNKLLKFEEVEEVKPICH